ncbi:MAG: AmiS/UreI family transporter [Firmicutes bacterium]|nr:AmiS/UreI family transporter [Bacillota bacterium]
MKSACESRIPKTEEVYKEVHAMGLLGFNMLFAGIALFLNGVSYFVKSFDRKTLGLINLLAAGFMTVNTLIGLVFAGLGFAGFDMTQVGTYANAAAGAAFALNFFILGIHHYKELTDFSLFGWFALLMSLFSIANFIYTCVYFVASLWIFVYLWAMWALLWGQAFIASALKRKAVDKASPYFVLGNALFSLLIPAVLFLFGVL